VSVAVNEVEGVAPDEAALWVLENPATEDFELENANVVDVLDELDCTDEISVLDGGAGFETIPNLYCINVRA
jgi:hypothetical protein